MIERRCWTFAEIFALGVFWGEMPCRRIGELIGRSKNEVISKARKLGLGKFTDAKQKSFVQPILAEAS